MVCEHCKTRNNYYYRYCYNCGEKLAEATVELADLRAEAEYEVVVLNKARATFNPYKQRKTRKWMFRLTMMLGAVVLIGLAYCIYLRL